MTETFELLARAIGAGYEIGELIGRGGFGEVYAAADRSLKRTVAIKVLRADVADSRTAVDRFRREAEALARLRHPHIMPVYGIGEGEGITYFVMPRIEGESLASLMERGERLSLADACRVIAEVADALAAAHRAGVVHRDIKPDNILLEGTEQHALLMDFGIAKSGGPGESRLTGTGMIIGTPMYMSPEQATGDHTGPASDIYSFGVVAYEVLSGRGLFGEVTSSQALITAHLTRTPDELRSVNPEVPVAVSRAVMRCLRKTPAERWASVDEFRQSFAKARADLPRDPEVAIPDAPPRLSRRSAMIVGALGIVGLATALGVYRFQGTLDLDAPQLSRDAALVDARRVTDALGVPRYTESAWKFTGDADHVRFLSRGNGPRPNAAALSRVRLGDWRFAFFTSGSRGFARVSVVAPGWVSEFERVTDSTAPRPAPVAIDPAKLRAVLALMGWHGDSLRLADSSRSTIDRREQRSFTWEPIVPTPALIVGGDTAKRTVEATFLDGMLTRYRARVKLPTADVSRESRRSTVRTTALISMVVLLVVVLAVDLVRARRDRALRFERALRIGVVTAAIMAIVVVRIARQNNEFATDFSPDGSLLTEIGAAVGVMLMLVAPFVFLLASGLAAAAEAVALKHAPDLLAGYPAAIAAPRPRRLATFFPIGAALGFCVSGAAALCAGITALLGGVPLTIGNDQIAPWSLVVMELTLSLACAPLVVLLVAFVVAHLRVAGQRIGDVASAVLVAGVAGGFRLAIDSSGPDIATWAAVGAGLALIVGRRGVVEGAVAFAVVVLTQSSIGGLLTPYANYWPATIALGAVVAMTLVALVMGRRGHPASPGPTDAATPSPA